MSFKTQAEIFQALLDGKRLKKHSSTNLEYFQLVDGTLFNSTGNYVAAISLIPSAWSIYEESKTKKQVWQWRYWDKQGTIRIDDILQTEEDMKVNAYYKRWSKYEKHAGPFEVEEQK